LDNPLKRLLHRLLHNRLHPIRQVISGFDYYFITNNNYSRGDDKKDFKMHVMGVFFVE